MYYEASAFAGDPSCDIRPITYGPVYSVKVMPNALVPLCQPGEIFREVKGTDGNVIISTRGVLFRRLPSGWKEIPQAEHDGYMRVYLKEFRYKRHNGTLRVHTLMAETFDLFTEETATWEVNHINHNRRDNSLDNLEVVTHADNMAHASRSKRLRSHTLTQAVKDKIIDLYRSRVSIAEISRTLGLGMSTVRYHVDRLQEWR